MHAHVYVYVPIPNIAIPASPPMSPIPTYMNIHIIIPVLSLIQQRIEGHQHQKQNQGHRAAPTEELSDYHPCTRLHHPSLKDRDSCQPKNFNDLACVTHPENTAAKNVSHKQTQTHGDGFDFITQSRARLNPAIILLTSQWRSPQSCTCKQEKIN